jgi:RNA-binding protein
MDHKLKDMRKISKIMNPNIIIGKNGLTEQVLENIRLELSKHEIVKLRILQTYISDKGKEKVFAEIAEKTSAKIIHKIGFTITLTKRQHHDSRQHQTQIMQNPAP